MQGIDEEVIIRVQYMDSFFIFFIRSDVPATTGVRTLIMF